MKKLMNKVMLSCKKATELIDKRTVVKLTIKEEVMLWMHTGMCTACTAYQKQSKVIDHLLHKHIEQADEQNVPLVTNEELKRKISAKM
jgi:hypothetical protein